MAKLLYQKDNLDYYITEEYVLRLNSEWLLNYIKRNTEYNSISEFSNWYNSEDVDEIISELDDTGMAYTLNKTGNYCSCDDLMQSLKSC